MNKMLILVGPTAVGKTAASIAIAKALNAEIISGDSMQVYAGMDIGTAKIKPEEMDGVPHHLIDVTTPEQPITAAQFKEMAEASIASILKKDRLPFIVGGTGLYINGLLYDYDFAAVETDPMFRQSLLERAEKEGLATLYVELAEKDPEAIQRIKPADEQRIIRALEVIHTTGEPYTKNQDMIKRYASKRYDMLFFAMTMTRSRLYERINMRVDEMVADGLFDEVSGLLARGVSAESAPMKGIGYKEVVEALTGKCSPAEAVETIKRNSRRFAKRQFTWFRRDPNIQWLDMDQLSPEDAVQKVVSLARKRF